MKRFSDKSIEEIIEEKSLEAMSCIRKGTVSTTAGIVTGFASLINYTAGQSGNLALYLGMVSAGLLALGTSFAFSLNRIRRELDKYID